MPTFEWPTILRVSVRDLLRGLPVGLKREIVDLARELAIDVASVDRLPTQRAAQRAPPVAAQIAARYPISLAKRETGRTMV